MQSTVTTSDDSDAIRSMRLTVSSPEQILTSVSNLVRQFENCELLIAFFSRLEVGLTANT